MQSSVCLKVKKKKLATEHPPQEPQPSPSPAVLPEEEESIKVAGKKRGLEADTVEEDGEAEITGNNENAPQVKNRVKRARTGDTGFSDLANVAENSIKGDNKEKMKGNSKKKIMEDLQRRHAERDNWMKKMGQQLDSKLQQQEPQPAPTPVVVEEETVEVKHEETTSEPVAAEPEVAPKEEEETVVREEYVETPKKKPLSRRKSTKLSPIPESNPVESQSTPAASQEEEDGHETPQRRSCRKAARRASQRIHSQLGSSHGRSLDHEREKQATLKAQARYSELQKDEEKMMEINSKKSEIRAQILPKLKRRAMNKNSFEVLMEFYPEAAGKSSGDMPSSSKLKRLFTKAFAHFHPDSRMHRNASLEEQVEMEEIYKILNEAKESMELF